MKNNKILAIILGMIFLVSSNILRADEEDRVTLTGNFEFGYRHVDVSGNINKYYEDLNIRKGPRLLSLNFDLLSSGKYKNYFDLLSVYASAIGGDPFESYGFTLKKYGAFNFRYGHRKSTYYYQDTILPPGLVNISTTTGGDFHTYSFERNADELYFDIRPMKRTKLFFSYDRQQRFGKSTTTLDLIRDEFELDKPLDELKTEYRAGLQVNFEKFDFFLEGSYRDYENNSRIFLPGFSEGSNSANFSELFSFELATPYDFKMPMVTARVNARPTKRIQATASYAFSDLDMNLNYNERGLGTNFNNTPLDYVTTGNSQISRKFNLADFDLSYRVHDTLYLIGGFRYDKLEQDGDLSINGSAPIETSLDIKTLIYEAGTQVLPFKTLSVTGGLRYETRKVSFEEEKRTNRTSFFFNAIYSLSNKLSVMGEYERGTYKDPYTLMSPTDLNRFKIRSKFKPFAGFDIILTYLRRDLKNEDSGGKFDSNTYSLDLTYSFKSKLYLGAGYSRLDIDSSISNVVTYFLQPWNIRYESANNIFRGSVKYVFNKSLSAGSRVDTYKNSGTWGLNWTSLRGWIKYTLPSGYSLSLSYMWNKYDEKNYNFDDYSSNIFTLGFGYSF
jgi:hypothetical protein